MENKQKKINRTKGKFVRGIRVDVKPNCEEEEKTRIIEQIVRTYFEQWPPWWLEEMKCIVSLSTNGKGGMHRIRVETDRPQKCTKTHKKILKELQEAGMQNVGLLQDDSIIYTKSGLKYGYGIRIGYLDEPAGVQPAIEKAISFFHENFAPWCTVTTDTCRYWDLSYLLDKLAYVGPNVGEFELEFVICPMIVIEAHQDQLAERKLVCWKSITVRDILTDKDVQFGLIMLKGREYLCEEY